jgi:hypothetical protein
MSNRFAVDLLRHIDPVALAKAVGPEPHHYQAALLRSRSKQIILNWARQAGKSSATAILPLHTALYQPDSLTLILSPSDRQSGLLLDKVYASLHTLGWRPKQAEKESARYIRLANGAEIWALPGKEGTIRGFSGVSLIVVDEASKTPDPLYYAVRPMLAASGGRIVLLSTPFGKRGFFFDVWTGAGDWERHEIPVGQVPHIDSAFVDQERRELPPDWFAQEYECQFNEAVGQVFSHELIESLFASDVAPLFAEREPGWSQDLIVPARAL